MTGTAEPDRIPESALGWIQQGRRVALATVVQTWGSAPRPVGAQLAITEAAEMAGSVSGGCVEGAVVAEALEILEDDTPRILEFGVSDGEAFAVGLACGGQIRVLFKPVGVGQGACHWPRWRRWSARAARARQRSTPWSPAAARRPRGFCRG